MMAFASNSLLCRAALKETAWWIAGRHPEWGEHLVGYFRAQLKQADKLTAEARMIEGQMIYRGDQLF